MRCGEVGDVICGEERQSENKEGDCVEGCFLREGMVEVGCTKRSSSEVVHAWEGCFPFGVGGLGNRRMMEE